MKKNFAIGLLMAIAVFAAQAQSCVPDSAGLLGSPSGYYPHICPDGQEAVFYSHTFNAIIPTDTTIPPLTAIIDSIKMNAILNLPAGLTAVTRPGTAFRGGSIGCVNIYGTPLIGTAGTYVLNIDATGYSHSPISISFRDTLFYDTLKITAAPPGVYSIFTTPHHGLCPGSSVCFTDTSAVVGGAAAINSWTWSFGDGGTSPDENPCHSYAAAGTYTVELIVSNGTESDTSEQIITIHPFPSISMTPDSSLCLASAATSVDVILHVNSYPGITWSSSSADFSISPTTIAHPSLHIAGPAPATADIYVAVVDANGCANADTSTINLTFCSSIQDPEIVSSLQAYPNPVNHDLHISFSKLNSKTALLQLRDALGKVLFESEYQTQLVNSSIPMDGLAAGVYSLSIQTENGSMEKRIVKQ